MTKKKTPNSKTMNNLNNIDDALDALNQRNLTNAEKKYNIGFSIPEPSFLGKKVDVHVIVTADSPEEAHILASIELYNHPEKYPPTDRLPTASFRKVLLGIPPDRHHLLTKR